MSEGTEKTIDAQTVARARAFAIQAHGIQQYGNRPYSYHLDAVVDLLDAYGPLAQTIGYLHDVAEDTAVDVEEIRAEFGDLVARCVAILTDPPGADRATRKATSHAKLAKVEGEERIALVVKAADRLANLREGVFAGNAAKLAMYRGEHADFRAAAYRPGLCDTLWSAMGLIFADRPD